MRPPAFERLVGLRVALVIDSEGSTKGVTGTSSDLSNPEDRAHLMQLRSISDVIITDANTARAENYRASKYAPIEVWSRNGDFSELNFDPDPDRYPVKLVHSVQPAQEIKRLAGKRVLVESGITLASVLLPEVSQLIVTIPHVVGNRDFAVTRLAVQLGTDFSDATQWHNEWVAGQTNDYLVCTRRGNH